MSTAHHVATTEMHVTSIRFEQELKDRLKELAGHQGYQALIRDVLWDYVDHKTRSSRGQIALLDVRATTTATAQKEERCVLTGQSIQPNEPMLLGLTISGEMVPICIESLAR